ncbi:unnamed protein product [Cylicostephanus goldi]|uniref:Uncharacterized protein n=1 Tax=Cylicostephanus goldi TaxID=71465 RepID=A0A3P6SR15_CYLGO|nr:unnamed protein product [Cylicostephanus goldi]
MNKRCVSTDLTLSLFLFFTCSFSEVDGAMICFRVVVVPPSFGLKHSKSDHAITNSGGLQPPPPIGLYPQLGQSGSTPALNTKPGVNMFTIKNPAVAKVRGEDGVPFKLNPQLASILKAPTVRLN